MSFPTAPRDFKPFWFVSFQEAADWLPFDCDEDDVVNIALEQPDKYAEWVLWAERWEAEGEPEF